MQWVFILNILSDPSSQPSCTVTEACFKPQIFYDLDTWSTELVSNYGFDRSGQFKYNAANNVRYVCRGKWKRKYNTNRAKKKMPI